VIEVEYREWNIAPLSQSFATAIAKNRECDGRLDSTRSVVAISPPGDFASLKG
jgi:hypothetical protein